MKYVSTRLRSALALAAVGLAAVGLAAFGSVSEASADVADASTGHIEGVEFIWDNGDEERVVALEPAFDPEVYSYTLELPRYTMGKLRVDAPSLFFTIYDYAADETLQDGIVWFPRGIIYTNPSSVYETVVHLSAPDTWRLVTSPFEINGQSSDAVSRTYTFTIEKKLGKITSAPGNVEAVCVDLAHAPPVDHPDSDRPFVWHHSRILDVRYIPPLDGGAFSNVIVKIKPEGGKAVRKSYVAGYTNEVTLDTRLGDFEVDTNYKGWIRGKNRDSAGPWAKFTFNCPDVDVKVRDHSGS